MNIFIIGGVLISLFIPIHAMDSSQQKMAWVITSDSHLTAISKHIAAQSALLTILTENSKISHAHPLPIQVNKKDLDFFCEKRESTTPLSAQNLKYSLTLNQYCALIDVADKLRTQIFYAELIDEVLPQDLKKFLIPQPIKDAYRNSIIKTNYTKNELISDKQYYNELPEIIISNDGHYCITDIQLELGDIEFKLWSTKTCSQIEKSFSQHYNLHNIRFSPNSKYIIVPGHRYPFVCNITEHKQYPLVLPDYFDTIQEIIISPDSNHIMISGILGNRISCIRHALWSLDENAIPEPITLNSPYWEKISSVTFHPDNKHIIFNAYHKTLQICPITSPNDIIPQGQDEDFFEGEEFFAVHELTITSDNTHALATNDLPLYTGFGHALFNIENLNDITCTAIPNHSGDYRIPHLHIPHKKLLTHIANHGTTLELLDTNVHSIASYTPSNKSIITTLAVDITGNYLASGYSDGAIIIWDLSDITKHIYGTKVSTPGIITSLIFGGNQLLLSQSGIHSISDEHTILWDAHGHKILDFGDTVTSIMSKNGNCIITACKRRELTNAKFNHYKSLITLTAWNVYNKKTKKKLDAILRNVTLSQAFEFYEQYQQKQEKGNELNY